MFDFGNSLHKLVYNLKKSSSNGLICDQGKANIISSFQQKWSPPATKNSRTNGQTDSITGSSIVWKIGWHLSCQDVFIGNVTTHTRMQEIKDKCLSRTESMKAHGHGVKTIYSPPDSGYLDKYAFQIDKIEIQFFILFRCSRGCCCCCCSLSKLLCHSV